MDHRDAFESTAEPVARPASPEAVPHEAPAPQGSTHASAPSAALPDVVPADTRPSEPAAADVAASEPAALHDEPEHREPVIEALAAEPPPSEAGSTPRSDAGSTPPSASESEPAQTAASESFPPGPVASAPVSTEPVSAEPESTEPPVSTEPPSSEPLSAEPMSSEPLPTEPALSEPVSSEPATEPVSSEAPAQAAAPEPGATAPAASEPQSSEPQSSEPQSSEPPSSEPPSSEPPSSEPPSSEPAAVEAAAPATIASAPAAIEPAGSEAVAAASASAEPGGESTPAESVAGESAPSEPSAPAPVDPRRLRAQQSWERVVAAHTSGEHMNGLVTAAVKGGLLVDVAGIRGFLPASQVRVPIGTALETLVKTKVLLKVLDVDNARRRIVVSQRRAVDEDRRSKRADLLRSLAVGQTREATVARLTDFGAFVDLGGIDGLIPMRELAFERIEKASDVVNVGEQVTVQVLRIEENGKKIALSRKNALPDPWRDHAAVLRNGTTTEGKVVAKEPQLIVEIAPGVTGAVRADEVNPADYELGEAIEVTVRSVDRVRRRIVLSTLQAATAAAAPQMQQMTSSGFAPLGVELSQRKR